MTLHKGVDRYQRPYLESVDRCQYPCIKLLIGVSVVSPLKKIDRRRFPYVLVLTAVNVGVDRRQCLYKERC